MATYTEHEPITSEGRHHEERHETEEARSRNGRRPVGSLLRELAGEGSALVRAEISLAKAEVKENLTRVERSAVSGAIGGAVLHSGLLTLLASAVLALSLVWPAWLSALVIGAVVATIGAILVLTAKRKMELRQMKPERTMSSLERDLHFARDEGRRARERLQ